MLSASLDPLPARHFITFEVLSILAESVDRFEAVPQIVHGPGLNRELSLPTQFCRHFLDVPRTAKFRTIACV